MLATTHPLTRPSPAPSAPDRIADALVVVSCAYTSLEICERFGLLDRDQTLYRRLWPGFRTVVFVSYGDERDHPIAAGLVPDMLGQVWCVCNDRRRDPGVFLAGVPDRVAQLLQGHASALVMTEQHWGGDVALCITRALRAASIKTGLCARTGYHWSWTMAREHGPQSPQFAQARFIEGELCTAADTIITTTPAIADALAFQHALPHDRLRIVPNYVLTDEPTPAFASRTPGLILTAGRLSREKRAHLLIQACDRLREPHRSAARLLIVGQGPEEAALRELAAGLRVAVEFRPRVPHRELLALMRTCSVYAQCSEYEGHPKTVIEAMASGCPAVVVRAPGLADHVRHDHTGLVAAPDPDSIASSLADLLADPGRASRLGAAAAASTRDALGFDSIFPFYREACVQAARSAGADRSLPPAVVRWDQPLLHLPPDAAAATWIASLDAYAKRLEPAARNVFLRGVTMRLGQAHVRPGMSAPTNPGAR